jgi:hypothetical protein
MACSVNRNPVAIFSFVAVLSHASYCAVNSTRRSTSPAIMTIMSCSAALHTRSRPACFADAASSSSSAAKPRCASTDFAVSLAAYRPAPISCVYACGSRSRVSAM